MEGKEVEIESRIKLEELYCDACQKPHNISTLLRCSQCKSVYYCSKECQKMHWKQHKSSCQEYLHIQEEIAEREEHVNSILQSCCNYSNNHLLNQPEALQGDLKGVNVEDEADKAPSFLKVFDLSHLNSLTCEICYEVVVPITNQQLQFFSFPTCNHGFCMNCIQSYFTLLDDGKEPPVKEMSDNSHFSQPTDSTTSQQRCPLCRNDHDPFDSTLWQFAYSNVNDFLFQRNLFPTDSLPHRHYTVIAKREYKRFLKLTQHFPSQLAPLQFDVLKLKMMPLLLSGKEDDGNEDKISDQPDNTHNEEEMKYCQQLLQREIKDISLKLSIYQTYLLNLIHLQKVTEAKELCEKVLEEVSNLSKSSLLMITSSMKCQEIISMIQYHYMSLLFQEIDQSNSVDDEMSDVKQEEKLSLQYVIRLVREALQRQRHDGRLYQLLSKVYERQGNREEATLILLIGLRYVFPWDHPSLQQLQDALIALERR